MVATRPTMRELKAARSKEQRKSMKRAIAEGRLTVRQMTPRERAQANRDRASGDRERAARKRRRAY